MAAQSETPAQTAAGSDSTHPHPGRWGLSSPTKLPAAVREELSEKKGKQGDVLQEISGSPTPRGMGVVMRGGYGLCTGGLGEGGPWNQPFMERRVLPAASTSDTWEEEVER